MKGVNLLVLLCKVTFSEPTVLDVLQCQSFPVKQGDLFLFGCGDQDRDELRKVESLLDRNRYSHRADGDYMLHHKNDNNRGEAAEKFRWLRV